MTQEKTWYVSRSGKVFGPFTSVQMRDLIARTKVRMTDWLRREGDSYWVRACEITSLHMNPVPVQPTLPITDAAHGTDSNPPNTGTVSISQSTQGRSRERARPDPSLFTVRPGGADGTGRGGHSHGGARPSRFRKLRGFVIAVGGMSLAALAAVFLLQGSAPRRTPSAPPSAVISRSETSGTKASNQRQNGSTPGIIGMGFDIADGNCVVDTLVVGWPAQLAGVRLGDALIRVGRDRQMMVSTVGHSQQEVMELLRGFVGESIWLEFCHPESEKPLIAEAVRRTGYDEANAVTMTWQRTLFSKSELSVFVPMEVAEQFPGSPRRYELVMNESQLLAAGTELRGRRIAVVVDLKFSEVAAGIVRLCLTEQSRGPTVIIERERSPAFFEAIVRNDPLKNHNTVLHVRFAENASTQQIPCDLEEIMFLDQDAPEVYKPLIIEESFSRAPPAVVENLFRGFFGLPDSQSRAPPPTVADKKFPPAVGMRDPGRNSAAGSRLRKLGYFPTMCLVCGARRFAPDAQYSDRAGYGLCSRCGQGYQSLTRAAVAVSRNAKPSNEDLAAANQFTADMARAFPTSMPNDDPRRGVGLFILFGGFATDDWDAAFSSGD